MYFGSRSWHPFTWSLILTEPMGEPTEHEAIPRYMYMYRVVESCATVKNIHESYICM